MSKNVRLHFVCYCLFNTTPDILSSLREDPYLCLIVREILFSKCEYCVHAVVPIAYMCIGCIVLLPK